MTPQEAADWDRFFNGRWYPPDLDRRGWRR